jgi:ankyrin repeat protein
VVARLLDVGADIGVKDTGGMTPLHYASSFGRLVMIEFLLKRGAKLESCDHAGFTPLLYAAEKGQMRVFEALLAAGANPKLVVKDGRTALHLICSNFPSPEWIERLVAAGIPVDGADVNRFTPLHRAAQWGRREAVEKLLKFGAKPNAVTSNRNTPLVFAAWLGEPLEISPGETKGTTEDYQAICGMLVRAGARFDIVPENGWTLLHSGASIGNLELIERALAAGVPIDSKDDRGGMPLHHAAKGGFTAGVELLLKHGADANAVDQSGSAPINLAAAKCSGDLIELLAKNGAKLNASDPKLKATPLHMAAAFHNVGAVKALLALGADVSARDYLGDTPLHVAVSIQEIDKIRDAGPASRDVSDMLNRSAVPAAAIQEFKLSPLAAKFKTEMAASLATSLTTDSPARSLATTKLLLEHGASPKAKDHDGLTPLDVAKSVGTPEILRLLENPPRASKK